MYCIHHRWNATGLRLVFNTFVVFVASLSLPVLAQSGAASPAATGAASAAQDYPKGQVKFVVGFPPGGSSDIVTRLLAQNFFVKQSYTFLGQTYQFVPFQISGSLMTIGGDNETLTVLFPNIEMAITLLEGGDGNRNSELVLRNLWLNSALQPIPDPIPEFYVGQGSTFSELTIECRFRSALDAVGDVGDQAAGALDEELLQHAVLEQGRPRFARTDVDDHFGGHGAWVFRPFRPRAGASSSQVSYKGSPITPE